MDSRPAKTHANRSVSLSTQHSVLSTSQQHPAITHAKINRLPPFHPSPFTLHPSFHPQKRGSPSPDPPNRPPRQKQHQKKSPAAEARGFRKLHL